MHTGMCDSRIIGHLDTKFGSAARTRRSIVGSDAMQDKFSKNNVHHQTVLLSRGGIKRAMTGGH